MKETVGILVTKSDNPRCPDGREVKVVCTLCGVHVFPAAQPDRKFRAEHPGKPFDCANNGVVIEDSID